MSDERAVLEGAAMRAAAEKLLEMTDSVGWKILMEQLHRDQLVALAELSEVDPTNVKEIMKAQNRVKRYDWFAETVAELIAQGFETEDLGDSDNGLGVEDDG